MKIKDLTTSQKKIILAAALILFVFIIFLVFIYLPIQRQVRKIKSELDSAQQQIDAISRITSSAKSLEEGIKMLQDKFTKLDAKFPAEEENALKALSQFAKEMNIELVSISPQPKVQLLEDDKSNISIEGKPCSVVPVSIQMRCVYKDLVAYLQKANDSLPVFATLERLNISKDRLDVSQKLDVQIDINLYLLG